MKTIILDKPGHLQPIERPDLADLAEGEALVRIRRIGICGTDYHAFRGNQPFFSYPRVLGHELGAEVIALNVGRTATTLAVRDRVSVEPYLNCGHCQPCRRGHSNCCENMQVLGVHIDGGMTEYLKVPIQKLHCSQKLTFDQLALVETLGIGLHAVNRAQITSEDLVLVIGAGPIGLAVAQFCRFWKANICVADRVEKRLQFVEENDLAHDNLLVKDSLTRGMLRTRFGGELPTIIFDATGNRSSMNATPELISHGGKIVYVGLFQGEIQFDDPNFHRREVTLFASRNSLPNDFRTIIELMELGRINTAPWLSHRTDFDNLPHFFPSLLDPAQEVIKAIVEV
jgi:2-desacetyl-2-hydroxyethyl bacteriochlorophyllide A dehydrogenase